MFGVSFTELVVIAIVALLLFGPDELPKIARTAGKFMAEFRRHSDSLRREFYNSVYPPAQEIKREMDQELRSLRALKHDVLSGPDLGKPASPVEGTPAPAEPSSTKSEGDVGPTTVAGTLSNHEGTPSDPPPIIIPFKKD